MKITGAKLWRTTLHTREPFTIAFETLNQCHGIVLELATDEGVTGLGEAGPMQRITGETWETAAAVLQRLLIPAILNANPLDLKSIHEILDAVIFGNPSAKASIDIACYDIIGKRQSKPVVSVLGGEPNDLLTDHTISIKPPVQQADKAEELVRTGFHVLKVKLGADPEDDIKRIKAIRDRIGKEITLRVDANQGWPLQTAFRVIQAIAPYGIELVEQPVSRYDWKGMAELTKRSPIPIAADETVHSPTDAERAVETEACHIINIKLMKCGGIYPAQRIAEIAKKANLKCMIGGMIAESRLAVSAAAHFAASQPVVRYFDLDADLLLGDELVKAGGIGVKHGHRTISNAPGLGVTGLEGAFLTPI